MPKAGWIVILILMSQGCAIGPDYQRPDVDTPESWRFDYSEVAEVANTQWWQQFNDPVLDELIDIALRENKDVREAAARVENFAALVGIDRADFFPQLSYDVNPSREQTSRELGSTVVNRASDFYNATLNVSWELDIWGRIRRATEAAQADLLAADEARRATILTLVSDVATGYVVLRALDRQREIAQRTIASREESLRLFELQFQGGVISELELSQARSEYEQAVAALPPIERDIALNENALSVLLGRNPGPIPRGRTIDQLMMPSAPAGVPSDLLIRRPDIRGAEQQLIAANARIGEARTQYFPTISLTGLFGYASNDLDRWFRSSASIWNLGAEALGPIFAGGSISSSVRSTEALRRQALVNYLRTIQTALREVNDFLISNQKSREELEAQARVVEALQDYARLARQRYDNGYAGYIEVLDAERSLFSQELNFVAVQSELYTSVVNIYKAMGGGWVIEAQRTADAVDYPPAEASESGFQFPEPVRPPRAEDIVP